MQVPPCRNRGDLWNQHCVIRDRDALSASALAWAWVSAMPRSITPPSRSRTSQYQPAPFCIMRIWWTIELSGANSSMGAPVGGTSGRGSSGDIFRIPPQATRGWGKCLRVVLSLTCCVGEVWSVLTALRTITQRPPIPRQHQIGRPDACRHYLSRLAPPADAAASTCARGAIAKDHISRQRRPNLASKMG